MFRYIVLVVSLLLASVAAYYSVFGLSHLFAGAFWAVVIMAGTIEISKLVSAQLLKTRWKQLSWFIRIYLLIGTIGIMVLTSAGIYGFLTNAYQQTLNSKLVSDVSIKNAEFKKQSFQLQIDNEQSNIDRYESRINKLTEIRTSQETRLDSLYARKYYSTAKRTEKAIVDANLEINKMNANIDSSMTNISMLNDSIAKYEIDIIKLKTNDTAAELGPLIYISNLTGKRMDEVINYFVIMIILVFDPMAIILLISFSSIKDDIIESLPDYIVDESNEDEINVIKTSNDIVDDEIVDDESVEQTTINLEDMIGKQDEIDKAIDELDSDPTKLVFKTEPNKDEIEFISNEDKFNNIINKVKPKQLTGFVKS